MAKKTVLFISRWYPSANDRMLGLFIQRHAEAVASAGWNVVVAHAAPEVADSGETVNGVHTFVTGYRQGSRWQNYFRWKKAMLSSVDRAVKAVGKPDIVHGHILTRAVYIAHKVARNHNVPLVISEHWSRYLPENFTFRGWMRKKLTAKLLRSACARIAVSQRLADAMRTAGLDFGYQIVPNAIDTGLFQPRPTSEAKKRVISITCFDEKAKNLRLLKEAAEILRDENYEFVLVGDGADFAATRQLFESAGVRARFTGELPPEAVHEELAASDVLVLSSNYETFGIVAYEAVSAGVPVVATDVADLKNSLPTAYCRIVPVGDAQRLAQTIRETMNEQNKPDRTEMHQFIEATASPGVVGRKLTEIYDFCIKSK